MNYKPFNDMGMELLIGTHKGVQLSLAEFPAEEAVSIYSITSSNPDKGEAQEAILKLKKMYKKVYSSTPLNNKIRHILIKHQIIFEE